MVIVLFLWTSKIKLNFSSRDQSINTKKTQSQRLTGFQEYKEIYGQESPKKDKINAKIMRQKGLGF